MTREGFKPDAITYLGVLSASASPEALKWVKEAHGHACQAGLESDLQVGNALVHMYVKIGSTEDARLVFHRMEKRDVVNNETYVPLRLAELSSTEHTEHTPPCKE
ncbi:unnamed protein product [Calypogeia fissa]